MRQLKFRIWDTLSEYYIYPENRFAASHCWITPYGTVQNMRNGAGSPELIIQQWTGLTDKNGKDIYEGDIFKGFHCPFKGAIIPYRPVEFHNGTFFVKIKGSEHPMYLHRFLENDYGDAILPEVIGNIFQNPELLQN